MLLVDEDQFIVIVAPIEIVDDVSNGHAEVFGTYLHVQRITVDHRIGQHRDGHVRHVHLREDRVD